MKVEAENILCHCIHSWDLVYDGDRFYTHSSLIQPVLTGNIKSILKIPLVEEEKRGTKVLTWWDGTGAVKVLKSNDDAILMERITGNRSLKSMSMNNQDDEATQIICEVTNLLHSNQKQPLPELTPLNIWFEELFFSAEKYGDIFLRSADIARQLLEKQNDITVLHGDIHHDNILYSSERGWLAIDPKGLLGERTFDYVNILCNPAKEIALEEGRLMKQMAIISKNTGIEIKQLLRWTAAWSGLSAVWFLNDNQDAGVPVEILKLVIAQLSFHNVI